MVTTTRGRFVFASLTVAVLGASQVACRSQSATPESLRVHEVGDGDGVVILLHGWGALGDDLVPIAKAFAPRLSVRFVVVEAPMARAIGGRAWFDLRADAAEQAQQIQHARVLLVRLVESLNKRGYANDRIVVAGFSQGAMMSLELAINGARVAGVGVLSGTELPSWTNLDKLAGVPILIAHGRNDRILPFETAKKMKARFEAAKANVTWHPFDGGHAIPPSVLDELGKLVRQALPQKTKTATTAR